MNKEPIGLYIFRFVLGLGLFAFMCMLYWSSVLIEQDMKGLRGDFAQLKNDLFSLRADTNKIRTDILQTIVEEQHSLLGIARQNENHSNENPSSTQKKQRSQASLNVRQHIDPSLPNLLEEDSFYAETLPKMLGPDFKPSGVFQSASIGHYDNLHPFSQWAEVIGWVNQCTVSVAKGLFGKYETFSPDMAIKMEERRDDKTGAPVFWVHLRDNVYWQPLRSELFEDKIELAPIFLRKHQVTAEDFKFYFDAVMNPYVQEQGAASLRTYLGDIEEIKIIDKLTFTVRWKAKTFKDDNGKEEQKIKYIAMLWTGALKPLPSFVYKYFPDGKKIVEDDADPETYRTNSVWAQNFSQHWSRNIIVSCGPWIFDGKNDRQIKFKRNQDYYFPYTVLVEGMEVYFKDSFEGEWQDFKSNKLDTYNIQPSQLIELETFLNSEQYKQQASAGSQVKRLDYVGRQYGYVAWNQAKDFFKSQKVRQALTMAIDRQRIIKQNLNGMGIEITGPFFPFSPDYDKNIKPLPFDLQKARYLLEEEGWYDSDGDGIIDKEINGKRVPFRFTLTYYVKNTLTKSICEYVATALKEVGIVCNLNGVDIADLSAALDDKSFEAISLYWGYGSPPEDPRQLWYSTGAKEKGSSNFIGFVNPEIDKIIDALDYEYNREKRIELYFRFDAIIHQEAPYVFLYTPKIALLYRDYVQNVFIPAERQDLVPGANIAEPDSSVFWLKAHK